MNEEQFIKLVGMLRDIHKKERALSKAFDDYFPDSGSECGSDIYYNIINYIFEITDPILLKWLTYYLWDREGIEGDLDKDMIENINYKTFKIKTPADLFKIIQYEKENKK